ncbi:MAG: DUF192 domain-containing protein [Acidobacteria bacterium]|nr:MAG: DUF192 domain-containing protein [Acidobacteriota bacterium]
MKSYRLSAISCQFVITLVAVTLIGCGGAPPDPVVEAVSTTGAAAPEPTRALPEAIAPDGRRLTLELALTRDEISQGLMFRNSLPDDRGMLFVFAEERTPSFWMKNTLIPLDMVFLSPGGTIVDVIHNALPCTKDPCPQYVAKAEALAVLEVAAGVTQSYGLEEGIQLKFERVPGFPRELAP